MKSAPVFFDPSGRRRRLLLRIGAIIGLISAVSVTLFVLGLLTIPFLPQIPGISTAFHHKQTEIPIPSTRKARLSRYLLHKSRTELWNEIAKDKRLPVIHSRRATLPIAAPIVKQPPSQPFVIGYYAPWQEAGLHSLRANADKLTHLLPEWLHLNRNGTLDTVRDWDIKQTPHNADVVQICNEHHLPIHPIFSNGDEGVFDGTKVRNLLNSAQAQKSLATELKNFLLLHNFQGLNVDFENLDEHDRAKLPKFLDLLRDTLHNSNLMLSLDVESGAEPQYLKGISVPCDFVVVMAYDEHYAGGAPGPIASLGWFYKIIQEIEKSIPPEKFVVGMANYAYDWSDDGKEANTLTYQAALILASDFHPDDTPQQAVDFDADALNPTFNYVDDSLHQHEVWMMDAVTAFNQWKLARKTMLKGTALWVLGSEDPEIWEFFDKSKLYQEPSADSLKRVAFPYEVEFEGDGEVLAVLSTPHEGSRSIVLDTATGLCTDMEYTEFPSSFVIQRTGYKPKNVVLSFDDGPSGKFTGKILDLLRDLGVHGSFFVIGENARRYPDLIERMWNEGHEIGSHTFTHPNMGAVTETRARLELNTTQRALQTILGRSTILFRPPYNADAEPISGEEVRPVVIASEMGYITIGEKIDPQDWNLFRTDEDGNQVSRTPQEIADVVLQQLRRMPGNVVLLHDGGGDRTMTMEVMKTIVPQLRKEGYNFTTLAALLGRTRDEIMPPASEKDMLLIGFDNVVFETLFTGETVLSFAFIVAIILGISRILFITPLAIIGHRKTRKKVWDENFRPTVSCLIAAYNEEMVVKRTIRSVFATNYPALEILIVDDGSKDGTSQEVESLIAELIAEGNPVNLRLIRQENGGKASALNNAIANSNGEFLFCLDADTQIAPDALEKLVRYFADEKIGAVAGNVQVGNQINLLTRWQAIEYITSQNVDRKAYSLLNAITVVPGAIGAWRRKAVVQAGGYHTNTMAEDMDLTWRMRRAGWVMATESDARAFTEAPDTFRAFFKQRFRWAYGTLQCLVQHRGALGRYSWFGWVALPTLWMFQVIFQVLAPLVDLQVLYALISFLSSWITRGIYRQDWQPLPQATDMLYQTAFFYGLFFAVELIGAFFAFRLDKEKMSLLWRLFWQRFVYRQLMYAVIWKSLWTALKGISQGWGKLQRKGSVTMPK